jgi:hypothetical protein
MRSVVYIAGPYSADTKEGVEANIQVAHDVAQQLWHMGFAVICPHMNSAHMDGSCKGNMEWKDAFKMYLVGDLEFISRCDAVVMLPGWEQSRGSCAEFAFAHWRGILVVEWPFMIDLQYSIEEQKKWTTTAANAEEKSI